MTDPDVSVLLHCAPWKGLRESQVHVELSDRYNRQKDSSLEHQVNEIWTERLSKEPWLFNGAKFRLHSFCLASPKFHPSTCSSRTLTEFCRDASDIQRDDCDLAAWEHCNTANGCLKRNKHTEDTSAAKQASPTGKSGHLDHTVADSGPLLTLRLGLTSYKDYLGTNWSCGAAELRQRGQEEFEDSTALLAQPLGVGAILCTIDKRVVFIRRSQTVAEAGGLLDIPGGHPEPKVVCERLGEAASEEQINMVCMQRRPDAVVSELFSSVCAEVRDEVNIPLNVLGVPVLLGVALNHISAGRPSAEFFVSCSLTSEEVRELYWKGGAEANESTDVVFLSKQEVLQLNKSCSLWSELCPSAKGAVLLYQMVQPEK